MYETISSRVRDIGDGLILAMTITDTTVAGYENMITSRLYFFRVAAQTRYYQEYNQLANITSGSQLPTSVDYDYLGDSGIGSGSDIFRMENDDWHMMHFGVGPTHPDLEVFHAISPSANGNPAQERNGEDEDIIPGTDDRGHYSAKTIPNKYDPPAFTERVSFRTDTDGEFLQWAFDNVGSNTLSGSDLELIFTGRGYKVQPVTDSREQAIMLQMAMTRPQDPLIDTIIHPVGGVNRWQLGSLEPDDWKTLDEMHQDFNVDKFPVANSPLLGNQQQLF